MTQQETALKQLCDLCIKLEDEGMIPQGCTIILHPNGSRITQDCTNPEMFAKAKFKPEVEHIRFVPLGFGKIIAESQP